MKEIPLTRGAVALVDDADFDWLSQWKWSVLAPPQSKTWYAIQSGPRSLRKQLMHRLILGIVETPLVFGDHEDGNGLNNQRYNLRPATKQQNMMHQRPQTQAGKASSFKGVHWCRTTNRWRSSIECDGKRRHLGRFDSEVDAARAYNEAAIRLFKEFAWLNEIPAEVAGG